MTECLLEVIARIRWPESEFLFELADFGSSTPKTKVSALLNPLVKTRHSYGVSSQIHISEGQLSADQQRCRYWKANRIRQGSFYQPSSPAAQAQAQGNGMGSSFSGFVGELLRWVDMLTSDN